MPWYVAYPRLTVGVAAGAPNAAGTQSTATARLLTRDNADLIVDLILSPSILGCLLCW